MFDYGWPGAEEMGRHGENVGYDLVGGRGPGGYYLVGGAGYEFFG